MGLTGPYFKYSDTRQLFINTGTTIVTFLMVFLIQNTQNRETRIVTLKLDELLCGVEGARTGVVKLDHISDEELEIVQQEFTRLRDKYAPLIDDDLAHRNESWRHASDGTNIQYGRHDAGRTWGSLARERTRCCPAIGPTYAAVHESLPGTVRNFSAAQHFLPLSEDERKLAER